MLLHAEFRDDKQVIRPDHMGFLTAAWSTSPHNCPIACAAAGFVPAKRGPHLVHPLAVSVCCVARCLANFIRGHLIHNACNLHHNYKQRLPLAVNK